MAKYASGQIGMTEMIQRAPMNTPFVIPVYGKKEAHQKERDAHGAAKSNNCKVSTSIMRAVDVSDYDYSMTLLRVTVVKRWVVSDFVDRDARGVTITELAEQAAAPAPNKEANRG